MAIQSAARWTRAAACIEDTARPTGERPEGESHVLTDLARQLSEVAVLIRIQQPVSAGRVLCNPWLKARKSAPQDDGVHHVEATVVVHITGNELTRDGDGKRHNNC